MGVLNSRNVATSAAADYFVFIGEISSSEAGFQVINKCGLMQRSVHT